MAINIDKIRDKIDQIKNNKLGKNRIVNVNLWRPKKEEEANIRLFANPHNDPDDPFTELHFHYDVSPGGLVCPQYTLGEQCPICDFRQKLFSTGKDSDREMAIKLFPTARFYGSMVDRADESLTPKYWGFSKSVYLELLEKLTIEDYADYLDVKSGLDVRIKLETATGKKYPDTKIDFKRKSSPLASSKEKIDDILSSVPKITSVFNVLSSEEIKDKLDAWNSPSKGKGKEQEVEKTKVDDNASDMLNNDPDLDSQFDELTNG